LSDPIYDDDLERPRAPYRGQRAMNAEHENKIDIADIAEAIGLAEDFPDPLDGLVEKSATNPGAAFTHEVLERLAALRKEDRAAFELLRSKLKKSGCHVTALDEAISEKSGDLGGRRPTQLDIWIDLAQTAELFRYELLLRSFGRFLG
jgi:hypothetical protein